jgi:hypothetical protein
MFHRLSQVPFRLSRMSELALGCFAYFAELRSSKINLDERFSELVYQLRIMWDEKIDRELPNRGRAQFYDCRLIVSVRQKDEVRR